MAGQGGLDADAMWAELKKADSSKIIDASHIPTSVLDGRWVKKAGDAMTGTLTSASSSGSIVFKGVENCDITNIYKDNGVIKNDDGGYTSIRNGLRFNWYDTYWYIGNLRGGSTESAGFGVVDHNNKLVLRVTPNDVRAPRFMSTVATGLSPLIVSSNTTVDNLSADLLDGYHAFGTSNALIKYGHTVGGTEPAWCRIATYSIRNTGTMTDVCFVLHSSFSDLFGLLVVRTRGTAIVEGQLIAAYNINTSNIRIYHDAEKKNIELYCYGGSNYSIIQANLLYSHDRNGGYSTAITLYRGDTKAPSWSTYVNPVFVNLQNSSEVAKKLQTPRTLWGQSFDGSANVSGNMTGVGSINMSGVLTIANSTYNKQLVIRSTGSTTKNQGEGIWFRCDDVNQEVMLRHEWYDTFVAGYGLAVSKNDSLEAGDSQMFFYNTGRFISKAPQGTAPYQCVSTTVNANLNADLLDGVHLAGLSGREGVMRSWLRGRYTTVNQYFGNGNVVTIDPKPTDDATLSANTTVLSLGDSPTRNTQLAFHYDTNTIKYRRHDDSKWNDWVVLIHSGNYASYSDGRYVKKAGDTMTGDLTMGGGHMVYLAQASATSTQHIRLQGGSNDYGRIAFGATSENAGWMEIASCDDGNEPIYARQYTGVFTTVKNTLTLLDANGDTVMSNNKGLSVGWGSRQVREGGSWVHGGADAANSDDANLRFGSWMGIGWYPTISGQTVAQGKNAMWLNTRTGVLNVVGGIKESTICIGRVNSSGDYDTAYNGEINRYDHHLYLQHHSGKYLIMCTGGGLAGIGTNSPGEKLHVAGNTITDGFFKSTVGTGTQPYQCSSTTLNSNLNADLLDGEHGAYYQNRMYDSFIAQYNNYNYIEFLRFVIPSGHSQLRAYVIFDLCRVDTGGEMSGRVVLRIRRGTDNNAGYAFYVTNFGRSWLPELRCTTNDGITWRVWMKCVKTTYDPYIAVKIVEKYPYGYVTTQNNGTTDTPSGSKYTFTASMAGLSNAANILVNTRNIFGQPFNGSGDVGGQMTSTSIFVQTGDATLKVYSGRITDARSDGNICLQTSIDATDGQSHSYPTQYQSRCNLSLQPRGGQVYIGQNPDGGDTGYKLTVNGSIKSNGNIIATGAVTAQSSSSDRRLKRNICDFSASDIIRKLHPKTFYWNETAKRLSPALNHDKLNYGLIAQDVESMPELPLFASNIFGDYLILQYEKFIPILIQGVKEVDDEVTRLKKRVRELEKRLGINN